jgi:hypothetical protein
MAGHDQTVSPLLGLLDEVERTIHLRRRDVLGRVKTVAEALERYGRALEEAAAVEFAKGHGLKIPRGAGVSPAKAAAGLLEVVEQLPELAERSQASERAEASEQASALSESASKAWGQGAEGSPAPTPSDGDAVSEARTLASVLPRVARAAGSKKLVILGALAGRRKKLPPPLDDATEWFDTAGGGRSTLGLPSRIKRGGIFALIICDQSVSHQHSEPSVGAARAAGIPVGFAGKGGAAAIARALEAIEDQLAD